MSKSPVKPSIQTPAETPPKLAPLPYTVLAFCDGACKSNPGRGGFGTVIILPDGEQIDIYGGEGETTNNRMELMGAILALEHSPATVPIQIWTDSGYVKNGITSWIAGWKAKNWRKADGKPVLNQELWQRLDTTRQNRDVSWHWLKGHAGHEGNEYADQLANLGVDNLPTPLTIKTLGKKKALTSDKASSHNSMKTADTTMNPNINPDIDSGINSDINSITPPDFHSQAVQTGQAMTAPPVTDSFIDSFIVDDEFAEAEFEEMENSIENEVIDSHFSQNDFSRPQFGEQNVSQHGFGENHQQPMLQSSSQAAPQPPSPQQSSPQNPVYQIFPQTSNFQNSQGIFIAQTDELIAQRPDFDGNTQTPNVFVPLLPVPKHQNTNNRQLILDTETTGFEATGGDRIIEIGIVEMINRKFTGEKLHVYINPNKEMDEEVIRIHGITNAFLADKPVFEQIGQVVYDFMLGAELIAHNAPFDMSFLVAEFNRIGLPDFASQVTVTDSLVIAKQQYAGQRNTLDALVKRLNVGKQDRTFHGALLDAEILAEVYLAMTGGQVSLAIDDNVGGSTGSGEHRHFDIPMARFVADSGSEQAHLDWITALKNDYPALLERWAVVMPELLPQVSDAS